MPAEHLPNDEETKQGAVVDAAQEEDIEMDQKQKEPKPSISDINMVVAAEDESIDEAQSSSNYSSSSQSSYEDAAAAAENGNQAAPVKQVTEDKVIHPQVNPLEQQPSAT